MFTTPCKLFFALVLGVSLLTSGALWMSPLAAEKAPASGRVEADDGRPALADPLDGKKKARLSCILLWMSGGPSQLDTFDPKPGASALFQAIDTSVKGVQFAETLPKLAQQAHHLTLIRSLNHPFRDHSRATHFVRTGYEQDPAFDFPGLGCVLAKELVGARPEVPRYLLLGSTNVNQAGIGPGFLGKKYRAIGIAGPMGGRFPLPPLEVFEALDKDQGRTQRNAVAKAFDLSAEKAELRNAYGRSRFGQGCLLARRLIECGVPVVEVHLSGWDAHKNAKEILSKRCADLDAGFATLVKDLHDRGRLRSTLIVCMGEFGRAPIINAGGGRDHHPLGFTVVLAGAGIKGGQVVGKTRADGGAIVERPVSPRELLATIYQALGVDASKKNRTPNGQMMPLVGNGQKAIQEALR